MATNLERYGVFALIFVVLLIVSISIWGPDQATPSRGATVASADVLPGSQDFERVINGADWATEYPGSTATGPPLVPREGGVAALSSGVREYRVLKGDNPSKIAKRFYGKETLFTRILEANPGLDPLHMQPGQVIVIPEAPEQRDPLQGAVLEPDAAPGSAPLSARPEVAPRMSPPATETAQAPQGSRSHTVRKGEKLSQIAKRYYGRSTLTKPIVDANPILTDPDVIREGWVLVIPERR